MVSWLPDGCQGRLSVYHNLPAVFGSKVAAHSEKSVSSITVYICIFAICHISQSGPEVGFLSLEALDHRQTVYDTTKVFHLLHKMEIHWPRDKLITVNNKLLQQRKMVSISYKLCKYKDNRIIKNATDGKTAFPHLLYDGFLLCSIYYSLWYQFQPL